MQPHHGVSFFKRSSTATRRPKVARGNDRGRWPLRSAKERPRVRIPPSPFNFSPDSSRCNLTTVFHFSNALQPRRGGRRSPGVTIGGDGPFGPYKKGRVHGSGMRVREGPGGPRKEPGMLPD